MKQEERKQEEQKQEERKQNSLKRERQKKKTQDYSIWKNTVYTVKNLWLWDKQTLFLYAARIPIAVGTRFFSLLMVKLTLDALEQGKSISCLAGCVFAVTAAMALLTWVNSRSLSLVWWNADAAQNHYISLINQKRMSADYEVMISKRGQHLLSRAKDSTSHWGAAANRCAGVLSELLTNLFGFFLYGGFIVSVSPWILLVLAAAFAVSFLMQRYVRAYGYAARKESSPLDAKLSYIISRSSDLENAKDIRMYQMSEWLADMFHFFAEKRRVWYQKTTWREFLGNAVDGAMLFLRDGAGYIWLIWMFGSGQISVSEFVFYFGAVSGFSVWLSGILQKWNEYRNLSLDISDLRMFLSMPDRANHGKGKPLPETRSYELSCENVGYRYPDSDFPVLRNINLTIHPGERLALVGENGAGKTTLVSLLCGLLTPDCGRITLNGNDIREYNLEEYQTLIAAVFQTIHFLPLSVEENITMSPEDVSAATVSADGVSPDGISLTGADRQRLETSIRASGLSEKLATLPEGVRTRLVRSVNPGAAELSGGEAQMLALARALYKQAPILILDEPTAFLDPIAESGIYEQYAALTEGKTSVYISHRLASTRFCDRIIFLNNGRIEEIGSHEELLRNGGEYARMFELQSRYYRLEEMARRAF